MRAFNAKNCAIYVILYSYMNPLKKNLKSKYIRSYENKQNYMLKGSNNEFRSCFVYSNSYLYMVYEKEIICFELLFYAYYFHNYKFISVMRLFLIYLSLFVVSNICTFIYLNNIIRNHFLKIFWRLLTMIKWQIHFFLSFFVMIFRV